MCMPKTPEYKPAIIPSGSNLQAQRQGDMEARLRRMRSGAAANILTSQTGIPANATLGGVS